MIRYIQVGDRLFFKPQPELNLLLKQVAETYFREKKRQLEGISI